MAREIDAIENFNSIRAISQLRKEQYDTARKAMKESRQSFLETYFEAVDHGNRSRREYGKILSESKDAILSQFLKGIYISALEAGRLTDDNLALAENMVDSYIKERGGADRIIKENSGKTYLLDRIFEDVEYEAKLIADYCVEGLEEGTFDEYVTKVAARTKKGAYSEAVSRSLHEDDNNTDDTSDDTDDRTDDDVKNKEEEEKKEEENNEEENLGDPSSDIEMDDEGNSPENSNNEEKASDEETDTNESPEEENKEDSNDSESSDGGDEDSDEDDDDDLVEPEEEDGNSETDYKSDDNSNEADPSDDIEMGSEDEEEVEDDSSDESGDVDDDTVIDDVEDIDDADTTPAGAEDKNTGNFDSDKEKENNDKFLQDLDQEEDVKNAVELIKNRVADAEQDFIKRNAEDKKKIDELLGKISDNVKTVKDISGDESLDGTDNNTNADQKENIDAEDEAKKEIAKEAVMACNRMIHDIRENKTFTVYEKFVKNFYESVMRNQAVRESFLLEDNTMDTPSIIQAATVMYGWLETVNTLQLEKVDTKYIEKVLNSIK